MPFEIDLPANVKQAGWKVKIREKERLEPPHVTIICKTNSWRVGLRDGAFLVPPGGSWNDVPTEVRQAVQDNWDALTTAWDEKYPSNPIGGNDDG